MTEQLTDNNTTPIDGHQTNIPASYSKFPLAIYITYGNVYVPVQLSQFFLPSPSPILSKGIN